MEKRPKWTLWICLGLEYSLLITLLIVLWLFLYKEQKFQKIKLGVTHVPHYVVIAFLAAYFDSLITATDNVVAVRQGLWWQLRVLFLPF